MKIIFSIALIINFLHSQPDSRFKAFDWILYRQTGSINSISEGYNYSYFATENAGILRFQLYQNQFGEPITTAQGLTDNNILAVHFDQNTGILWAASESSVDYSYNAEGNWFHIDLDETGIHPEARIQQIGSSNNYIWINAGNIFLKLDKVSGIVLGLLPLPDEDGIIWSSKQEQYLILPNTLKNYNIMHGWILNDNQFINPIGAVVTPNTFYFGQNSEIYIGMEDGTILTGDDQMETFHPYSYGLNNTSVTTIAFTKSEDFWIAGRNNYNTNGITKYYFSNYDFKHIDFKYEINLNPKSFYSILEIEKEVWFGSKATIAIYSKKKDYWREITDANGVPEGIITAMAEDTSSIWVGSTRGLAKISKISKRTEPIDFGNLLSLQRINDLEIVKGNLWIATNDHLLIYDQKKNMLIDFKSYGNIDNIVERKNIFSGFGALYQNNDGIYASTQVGVLKYNIIDESWSVVVEPSDYLDSKVNNIIIVNKYCFIGTNNGIWQINIDDGYSQLYDYPFIGSVQDMYILGDTLLIGSENGLIKYLWKKNL